MKLSIEDKIQTRIPTKHGEFTLHYYRNNQDDKEHMAFVKGDVADKDNVPVRIHSECFTGDVLGSRRCDCGEQLDMALDLINQKGFGVLLYLRQEGRGIGLYEKLKAYNLQDQGLDTVDANLELGHLADERRYDIAALILNSLKVRSVALITNNPQKINDLTALGITVNQRIAIQTHTNTDNIDYLKTKAERMHHMLSVENNH